MQDSYYNDEEKLSITTISAMVRALNSEMLKNPSLANELLQFLRDRNIEVPTQINDKTDKNAPITYNTKKPSEKLNKLRRAFEGVDLTENIL